MSLKNFIRTNGISLIVSEGLRDMKRSTADIKRRLTHKPHEVIYSTNWMTHTVI
jgi:hypothetical protein